MSLRNPVKYPVSYYSWQDTQAPQLTDADGVIKTILKACLVTGYGSKAGAGWTALFEDDYRIVLRRPLRTGNPPDIKIENGTITSTTVRHRIVAQDNPAGLDDATEVRAVKLLSRGSPLGLQWHCIVTDFGVLMAYQIAESGFGVVQGLTLLYIGSITKISDISDDVFVLSEIEAVDSSTGKCGPWGSGLIPDGSTNAQKLYNVRTNQSPTIKIINISGAEKSIDNGYFAQKILLDNIAVLPFFCALQVNDAAPISNIADINNRRMLRIINRLYQAYSVRALYIPLDYWEL